MELKQAQLDQIKIFMLSDFDDSESLSKAVNKYVVELFSYEGNYPRIETNSKFISVISNRLVDVNYVGKL